jgi:hypothetical protein
VAGVQLSGRARQWQGYLLAQQPGQQDPWSVTIASLFSLVTRARRESHAVLMNV